MPEQPRDTAPTEHTAGWTEGGVYGCPELGHETVWFPDWASYAEHMEAEHAER